MENIGLKLKTLRQFLKMTQKKLAAKLPGGTDYTYIGKIERNEQVPSLKILQKIAAATGVDLAYFFSDRSPAGYFQRTKSDNLDSRILKTLEILDPTDKVFLAEILDILRKYNKLNKPANYALDRPFKSLKVAEKGHAYKVVKKK